MFAVFLSVESIFSKKANAIRYRQLLDDINSLCIQMKSF